MTEIIRLSDQDITALEKIEKDAEEFSEKKLELYNDYRRMLSEECVRYIGMKAELPEMIELSSIDLEKRDKWQMYAGTTFIEHEMRNAWYAVRTKKIDDAKAFFSKPLGIFNVCDFKEFCSITNCTMNIVGVTLLDDGENYLAEFPHMPYLYLCTGDVSNVHSQYILAPLSRINTNGENKSSIISSVSKLYLDYAENMEKLCAKIDNYSVSGKIEKYPSSW